MNKQQEALKLALEALEIGHEYAVETAEHFHIEMAGYKQHRHDAMDAEVKQIADAITAIREALAEQPAQQEPVISLQCAHCQVTIDALNEKVMYLMNKQFVELTEEEIDELDRQSYGFHRPVAWRGPFARAIEAKLKEKNHG